MFFDYWLPLFLNWLAATTILFIVTWRYRHLPAPSCPSTYFNTGKVLLLYLTLCFIPLTQYPPDFWVWLLH